MTFTWGVATSAYQIEGAAFTDGRTASIWDTFARDVVGETGEVACDHYHRMPDDVQLIKSLGVDAYRFSVSWPRVQPGGKGPANPAGLDFYDRLVDELLAAGIDPWLTLYHWDLPQELEDAGGWPVRDTAYRFADYSALVFDRLSDRVRNWGTVNEPWCVAYLGYEHGVHAPGRRDFQAALDATHHLLLGHGLVASSLRREGTVVGPALNIGTATPASGDPIDIAAARLADGMGTRIFLDPIARGAYPADVLEHLAARGHELPVRDGDLKIISAPIDILGVNFYFGQDFSGYGVDGATADANGLPIVREIMPDVPRTALGWPITPDRFTTLLLRLQHDYGIPLAVTENGAVYEDVPDAGGFIADHERTAYLAAHVDAVFAARSAGADVRGYFAWSLMDNFEWAEGYTKRFGLVHVDYETQMRSLKRSALWFRDRVRSGA
ncbi:putative beta-glucosidase [Actinoplanes missouriensis 431]|uniref:Beta-glucosidase n=1 Tax=Actinoplanes missouriensis (strain ATCC 14538 / DSM 43046 / CBS 188.64 / JCM 3121 / NBRC 102363 / NCIMB 12654 / NRRL B-3342 / UNCC 431) TaxID=512565 RepID=I0HF78_ACTM4|nr:GH1 family beta-glucosidase [Actinoplanes missouriensis]BAL91665.1 putative beta-glucosidase [Actinoplanes missouriensis 431]